MSELGTCETSQTPHTMRDHFNLAHSVGWTPLPAKQPTDLERQLYDALNNLPKRDDAEIWAAMDAYEREYPGVKEKA